MRSTSSATPPASQPARLGPIIGGALAGIRRGIEIMVTMVRKS
jgi:hypothetical protein